MSSVAVNTLQFYLTPRQWMLVCASMLASVGLITVTSASMDMASIQYGSPFFYAKRHGIYLIAGLVCGALTYQLPLAIWKRSGAILLVVSYCLLILVLVPGVGKEVNGSTRWIHLGFINIQVSELVKVFTLIYVASYLARRAAEVRQSFWGFIKPILVLLVMLCLLLKQPDFGAVVVIMASVFVMIFLAGVRMHHFLLVFLGSASLATAMVMMSEYRMKRILAYVDPWADQFSSGYQLVQSLIAFGRGEWFGVGLGNSIQKLFYLPEAHTDFIFSIVAEEFGFFGNLIVIVTFIALVIIALRIGRRAEQNGLNFNAYLIYGLGFMIGLQAMVNIGVASGLLPTKGLTLPLISYGGSSMIVVCIMLALIMRADFENQLAETEVQRQQKAPRKSKRPVRGAR